MLKAEAMKLPSPLQTNHLPKKELLANSPLRKQPVKFSDEMKRLFPSLYQGKSSSSRIRPKQEIQKEIRHDPERKRLYKAAQDFQAIFIGQMLKSMRKNLDPKSDPLYGGNRQEIFQDMLYDEYAKGISRSKGFDLADQIYEQMSRSMLAPPAQSTEPDTESPNRYIPGRQDSKQRYAAERLRRQIEQAKNRISTSELYKEGDWRP